MTPQVLLTGHASNIDTFENMFLSGTASLGGSGAAMNIRNDGFSDPWLQGFAASSPLLDGRVSHRLSMRTSADGISYLGFFVGSTEFVIAYYARALRGSQIMKTDVLTAAGMKEIGNLRISLICMLCLIVCASQRQSNPR